jgi:hypothetical protein
LVLNERRTGALLKQDKGVYDRIAIKSY